MNLCPQCNAILAPGAIFCSNCGTPKEASHETACPVCTKPITHDRLFCHHCGTKMDLIPSWRYDPSEANVLTIKRMQQIHAALKPCYVTTNGYLIGHLTPEKPLRITVAYPIATVLITVEGVISDKKTRLKLRLGTEASVLIRTQLSGNIIIEETKGVEVMEIK